MASIRKEGKIYYLYFREGGIQKKPSLRTTSRQVAERVKVQIENELAARQFNIQYYSPHLQKKLPEFLKEAIEYSKVNKAPRTVEREEIIYNNFLNFCGPINISKVGIRLIEKYKMFLQNEKNFSSAGINIELRHLSSAFTLALKYGYIQKNPFREVSKVKVPKKKPVFLTSDQISALLKHTSGRSVYPYILTAVSTGTRLGEIAGLKWENIDMDHRVIKVMGKGSKERIIPIPANLLDYLKCQKNKTGHFIKGSKKRVHVSITFRKYADEIGLKGFKFHNLRDTYASHLVQNGINLKVIQKLLGHESIQTTLIYAHLSVDDKFKAVEIMDTILNRK